MINSDKLTRQQVVSLLPKFFIYLIVGFILSGVVGAFVQIATMGEDPNILFKILQNPTENLAYGMPILLIQGASSIVIFLITPLLFISKNNFPIHYETGVNKNTTYISYMNIAFMMFMSLPLISFLGELNANIDFGADWILKSEENAKSMMILMTSFKSLKDFMVGILIVAVLAAAGEELLFRGVLQPMFQKLLKNEHLGIIATAFLFSAIHMQFLSFLPRFIIGIVLGYLYHYSKNLWVPIVGHFVNNATALVIVYNFGIDEENIPVESLQGNPIWAAIISLLIITGTILYQKRVWSENLSID